MIEKLKNLSYNMKLFIALILMLLIGIALRWNVIVKDAKRSFDRFKKTEQTDSINEKQDSVN